jgi:hypothetical protein
MKFLETVDPQTTEAVAVALKRWRFARLTTREGKETTASLMGRLLFYFLIINGKPEVLDAAAAILEIDQ